MTQQGETNVWKKALLKFSPLGYRLYRNQRYVGPIVRKGKITKAWADCGLVDGAGDLVGWRKVLITADMVGKHIAQFCNFEAKITSGKEGDDQVIFRELVTKDGGEARVIRPEDVE